MIAPEVAIILGSESDLTVFKESKMTEILDMTGISYEVSIISADRNDHELREYCGYTFLNRDYKQSTKVFIGAAGMLPVLPGSIASIIGFYRPVLCVPLDKDTAKAMTLKPAGAPVPVAGIGKAGLYNAAIIASQIIALCKPKLNKKLFEVLKSIKEKKPAKIGIITSSEKEEK